MTVARQLSKKLAKYKYAKSDINQLLFHRLNKEANDRALYMKVERGVETTEKVNVELTMHELRQFARDYGVTELDNFIKSS
mgnify:CR=1 FL=1